MRPIAVIGRRLADRLFENRRIRGNAGETVPIDQLLEMTILNDLARQKIQPDGLAFFCKRPQRVHACFHFPICAFAAATTLSTVKPKAFIKSLIGADAPK